VSLGLKQMGDDPWNDLTRRYPEGTRVKGRITNIAEYGCFVELQEGVEGLVHVSEMDWTNKNVHPSKLVHVGQEVEVVILDIDQERRRISLGMKQCQPNPWEQFAAMHNKSDRVKGVIKSITDFGIFIGLEGGIDGLVHLSDVSWTEEGEQAIRKYSKGEEIETVVLAVDAERERISLGIKQLERDPFSSYVAENPKGSIVKAKVVTVEEKNVTVQLADGVEGQLKASELSLDKEVDNARNVVKEGEELEVKITAVDRKKRTIAVSVRAKESDEESAAVREYAPDSGSGAKLGDILKEHLDND
jgi:small subunit ribosomal protein S1